MAPMEVQPSLSVTDGRTVIDVRNPDEVAEGMLPGAVAAPLDVLLDRVAEIAEPGDPLLVYCQVGLRSLKAVEVLREAGYPESVSLAGGVEAWRRYGLPWNTSAEQPEMARYQRHLRLQEVGKAGQQRLLDASVLVLGAGGLGSPAALYLAAAGVGRIGLVDADRVDLSNLQRQIMHTTSRIGEPKVTSGAETLTALNPEISIETHQTRFGAGNALGLLADYDVVIDGADNFPTRYLLNDAALITRTPVVHGSVFRFEGQVSVFQPYEGPCYRCLFPEPPPPEAAPNCAEAGVLGVLPGIIGTMQATEAIKLILGIGEPLIGTLLYYDSLAQSTEHLRLRQNPECRACADPDRPPPLVEYDHLCRPITEPPPRSFGPI